MMDLLTRSALTWCLIAWMTTSSLQAADTTSTNEPDIPGLGDPGKLEKVIIEEGQGLVLNGPDARLQLIVTGQYSSGQLRDLTHDVTFSAEPGGNVTISDEGLVLPLSDGKVTLIARTSSGETGKCELTVQNYTNQPRINFPNQIVPIFTKLGCNAGGCHGKASGQNGFKLSLLGFYPEEDFEYLVKEGRGRRLFPAAPDQSLLLLKATNIMPHGGGKRLEKGSYEYNLMRRWVAQGMPYGEPEDPTVARIEVIPPTRTMDRKTDQQIRVIAHYSNGTTEDVTQMAQYEPNDTEMAEVDEAGLVTTFDLTGDVAIMARYQGNVDIFRASIPLGIKVENLPAEKNLVDKHVFNKLKTLGIPPSDVCDDATFIRRVTVDIAGRLPTKEEAEKFLASTDANKRSQWIDDLLASTDYADNFAKKWSAVLRNKQRTKVHARGTYAFHSWIRQSLHQNKPYDHFVRDIIAASGDLTQHPPVVWYREVNTKDQQVEDVAQLFLGLRIQCARCHHHPFERWSQNDYYGFEAFFARVATKEGVNGLRKQDEARVYHSYGQATSKNPKSNETLKPTGLASPPLDIAPDDDPRQHLVDWMSKPENPFFAPALVNRYWKHFFNRGIVDPEDDMRVTNPASNPELLEGLSKQFIESGFDMKDLIRTICNSHTYQLSSEPNPYNLKDKQNYSRYYPKRLSAEVLYDSILQVTNNQSSFNGMPAGYRAVQLPDNGVSSYFLTVFGMPQGDTACECERSSDANLAQSLHLLNSNEIQGYLSRGNSRPVMLSRDKDMEARAKIKELFLWSFSREPIEVEYEIALGYLEKAENEQQAFEDITWALINSKEFLFNH